MRSRDPWVILYLSFRNQVVKLSIFSFRPRSATGDVIQGSLMSSLLLHLHVIDVFKAVSNGFLFLMANDSKVDFTFQAGTLGASFAEITQACSGTGNYSSG